MARVDPTQPFIEKPADDETKGEQVVNAIKDTCMFYYKELFEFRDADQHSDMLKRKFKDLHTVAREEKQFIRDCQQVRENQRREMQLRGMEQEPGDPHNKFSVAFSGGGIRAAAFQAGVLWRLAEMNKLKDVEYLSAVSGGSYITTAFATHCMGSEVQPTPGMNINDWYRQRVIDTIKLMQENAGNFIRDCVANPGYSATPGEWRRPRWTDTLCLVFMVIFTMSVNPVVMSTCVALPLALITDLFYGSALRASFCAEDEIWLTVWWNMTRMDKVVKVGLIFLLLTFVGLFFPAKPPAPWINRLEPRPDPKWQYRLKRSIYFLGARGTLIIGFYALFLFCIPLYERVSHSKVDKDHDGTYDLFKNEMCCDYINSEYFLPDCTGYNNCTEYLSSCPDHFQDKKNVEYGWLANGVICDTSPAIETGKFKARPALMKDPLGNLKWSISHGSLWVPMTYFLVILLIGSVLLFPFFGAGLILTLVCIFGPIILFTALVLLATIPIFGPITKGIGNRTVNYVDFNSYARVCIFIGMLLTPFYEAFRNFFHVYYAHILSSNFFRNGKNPPLVHLGKDENQNIRNPWSPFIIFTGTCSDYQAPGDDDSISEVSFSPLHIGCEETDYIPTQHWFTMGTGTALSGAGCIDGIGLAMSDMIVLRFWLELLNLAWGDFVVFDAHDNAEKYSRWAGKCQDFVIRMYFRAPSMLILFFVYYSFFAGFQSLDCQEGKFLWSRGLFLFAPCLILSLFDVAGVNRIARFMTMSPFIRQAHQVLKFTFAGKHPPPMMYVTDGGVQDCTTVGLLMKRRVERIIMISCGQDPACKMGNFKDAMKQAQDHHLGTFYVPEDPRKTVWTRLNEFQEDKSAAHLHIGIRYPEVKEHVHPLGHITPGVPVTYGHLLIVKNKLPMDHELFAEGSEGPPREFPVIKKNGKFVESVRPVLPRISEYEVMSGTARQPNFEKTGVSMSQLRAPMGDFDAEKMGEFNESWKEMQTQELGPVGCCDCCNQNGATCLKKWPQGFGGNYLYLSPMFASSLIRLGHELSEEPLKMISEMPACPPLQASWERTVDAPSTQSGVRSTNLRESFASAQSGVQSNDMRFASAQSRFGTST